MTQHPQFRFLFVLGLLLAATNQCLATEWADKMFEQRTHDYGTVARGAKAEFVFEFTNIYEEDIHVSGIRANCGCVTPTIMDETIKTWGKGRIHARFNTSAFVGKRTATIIVTLDKPYPAEVQLQITGLIRNDIHFQPGTVNFSQVSQGGTNTQTFNATRYNNSNWKIIDVLCMSRDYEVFMRQLERNNRRVTYELKVKVLGNKPVGAIHDQLIIVSNDRDHPRMVMPIEGEIVAALTLSPARVDFGEVEMGKSVTKKVFLRSGEAMELISVKSESDCFKFSTRSIKDNVSMITVTLTPSEEDPDPCSKPVLIEARLGQDLTIDLPVTATILPPLDKPADQAEDKSRDEQPVALTN